MKSERNYNNKLAREKKRRNRFYQLHIVFMSLSRGKNLEHCNPGLRSKSAVTEGGVVSMMFRDGQKRARETICNTKYLEDFEMTRDMPIEMRDSGATRKI